MSHLERSGGRIGLAAANGWSEETVVAAAAPQRPRRTSLRSSFEGVGWSESLALHEIEDGVLFDGLREVIVTRGGERREKDIILIFLR